MENTGAGPCHQTGLELSFSSATRLLCDQGLQQGYAHLTGLLWG